MIAADAGIAKRVVGGTAHTARRRLVDQESR